MPQLITIKEICFKIQDDLNHKNITEDRKINKIFLQFKIGKNQLNSEKFDMNSNQKQQKMNKKLEINIANQQTELKLTLYKHVNESKITKIICQTKFNIKDMKNFKNKCVILSLQDEKQSNKTLGKISFEFQFMEILSVTSKKQIQEDFYELDFEAFEQYENKTIQKNDNLQRKIDFTFKFSQMYFLLEENFHKFKIRSLSLAFLKQNKIYQTKFVNWQKNSKGQLEVKWQEIEPINFYENDDDDFWMQILTKKNNNKTKSIAKAKINVEDLKKERLSKYIIQEKGQNIKYGKMIMKTETKVYEKETIEQQIKVQQQVQQNVLKQKQQIKNEQRISISCFPKQIIYDFKIQCQEKNQEQSNQQEQKKLKEQKKLQEQKKLNEQKKPLEQNKKQKQKQKEPIVFPSLKSSFKKISRSLTVKKQQIGLVKTFKRAASLENRINSNHFFTIKQQVRISQQLNPPKQRLFYFKVGI